MLGWMSSENRGAQRIMEPTGAYDGGAVGARSGLMTGTRVATALGWRAVEAVSEGDLVLTFDAGLQRVTKITRQAIWNGAGSCPQRFWPLHVPAGALGNRGDLHLMPEQYVMVESDAGEELFGDPFSLIMAHVLEGMNGIEAIRPDHGLKDGPEAIVLHFETDQVIFAESGVLFYCPSACGLLDQAVSAHVGAPYKALRQEDADVLVMCIESEKAASRLWADTTLPAANYAVA